MATITEELLILIRSVGAIAAAGEIGKVTAATEESGKKAKAASKEHLGFKSALGSLKSIAFQAAGMAGVGGLAVGIGESIKAAQNMQVANAQLGQAIKNNVRFPAKDATEQMQKFAESLSVKGGFVPTEAMQSMSRLLSVTQDTAKAEKDMALASNIARGAHLDLTTATRAVMAVEGGRTNGLTRMGIFVNQVKTAQNALTASHGKHTQAQKDQAKAQDALATKTQAMTALWQKYGHTTDAYSKTSAGAISNLRATVELLEEKLGRKLLPTITKVVTALSRFVQQMMDGKGTGGQVVDMLKQMWGWLTDLWKIVKDNSTAFEVLGGVLIGVYATFKAFVLITKIVDAIKALSLGIRILTGATEAQTVAQEGLNFAMLTNPVFLIVAAIAALVAAFVVLWIKCKWFRDFWIGLWNDIKRIVTDGVKWVVNAFHNVIRWLSSNWPLVAGLLFGPIGLAIGEIIKHWKTIEALPGRLLKLFKDIGNDIANAIIWPFKFAFQWVSKHLPSFHTHHIGPIPIPLPSFPGLAAGGITPYSGAFVVGERGPELVTLPKGSSVTSNEQGGGQISELINVLRELVQQERQMVIAVDGRPLAKAMMRQGLLQQSLS
jgi:hypothetical protein